MLLLKTTKNKIFGELALRRAAPFFVYRNFRGRVVKNSV